MVTIKRRITPSKGINGVIAPPGDKSISHRAVMLASLADGESRITGFLYGEDCKATINCFRELGVQITENGGVITIQGRGLHGLRKPSKPLYTANSGTTIRLMSGILAAQAFGAEISGDEFIEKRPMKRIVEPLTLMGANICGTERDGGVFAPLKIAGRAVKEPLKGIEYKMNVASAQVKSCVLLAGLYAKGETAVTEPAACRDHTERMLRFMGVPVTANNGRISLRTAERLAPRDFAVPGDVSSAAFWLAAALIVPNSKLIIKNVGMNPTRNGIIKVLREMGGEIEVMERRTVCGEDAADLRVTSSLLRGVNIGGSIIPNIIDEIPVLAVAAACAKGRTVIRDARELRVKETDRLAVMAAELSKMGVSIEETEDGLIIEGGKIRGGETDSRGDHRAAMSCAVAALAAVEETYIENADVCEVSYPNFFEELEGLC